MTLRSGPGGAGSDPRGAKTTPRAPQEHPKSRPEAVSEQPWSGAQEAPGALRGGFWTPWGSILAPPGLSPARLPPARSLNCFRATLKCLEFIVFCAARFLFV